MREHRNDDIKVKGREQLGSGLFVQLDRLAFLVLKLVLPSLRLTARSASEGSSGRSFNLRSSFKGNPIGLLDTADSTPSLASMRG